MSGQQRIRLTIELAVDPDLWPMEGAGSSWAARNRRLTDLAGHYVVGLIGDSDARRDGRIAAAGSRPAAVKVHVPTRHE